MQGWNQTQLAALEALRNLAAARERDTRWPPMLKALLDVFGASGGQIRTYHSGRILAAVEDGEGNFIEIPFKSAGRQHGTVALRMSGEPDAETMQFAEICLTMAGLVLECESEVKDCDRLINGAAHDLRGSLVTSGNLAQLLASRPALDDETRQIAGQIASALDGTDRLLQDLAAYAAAGRRRDALGEVSMRQIVEDVRWRLKPALQSAAASLLYEGEDVMFISREKDIVDIVERITDNSLKFSGENPRISVRCERPENTVTISVTDSGPPFDASYADSIFEPFQRLHGRRFRGHGLGLAICSKIVAAMGGVIRAEPAQPGGLTVRFSVPQ